MSTLENQPVAEHATSIIAGLDGPTKAGKGAYIEFIGEGYERIVSGDVDALDMLEQSGHFEDHLDALHSPAEFRRLQMISCGNYFRALALFRHTARVEYGESIDAFNPAEHTMPVVELLARPGIEETLQKDPDIRRTVSDVGAMPGSQAVAGAIFREHAKASYRIPGSLTMLDAREPVEWLRREEGLIGLDHPGQIDPRAILPMYLHTDEEVAAMREGGDYQEELALISRRRWQDMNRDEYPVPEQPEVNLTWEEWVHQAHDMTRTEVGHPVWIDNNADGFERPRQIGLMLAAHALVVAHSIERVPETVRV